jgi:hypothetical protein
MAGITMWLGGSSNNCMMRSPRSVSITSIPQCSKCFIELAFLREHGFTFDHFSGIVLFKDPLYNGIVLFGIGPPNEPGTPFF